MEQLQPRSCLRLGAPGSHSENGERSTALPTKRRKHPAACRRAFLAAGFPARTLPRPRCTARKPECARKRERYWWHLLMPKVRASSLIPNLEIYSAYVEGYSVHIETLRARSD